MANQFINGYVLLIGVDENAVSKWDLPDVVKDIDAFRSVLIHPERSAYLEKNVKSLTGKEATRENILDGLAWLQDRMHAEKDGNSTVVVYYSGHGWRDDAEKPPDYYLIPYNVSEYQIRSRALRASDFAAAIKDLNSQRLLVILDCCHSGGMGIKGTSFLPEGYVTAAVSPLLLMGSEKAVTVADGAKGLEELTQGAGRAVISSSQGHQLSFIRKDRKMSIFTYHLIEALTGHAQPQEKASEVLVTDVMSHVCRNVPKSVEADWNEEQVPDYRLSGNFPVALLLGGKGLTTGQSAPDPYSLFNQHQQTVSGDQINIKDMSGGVVMSGTKVKGDFHQAGRDIRVGDQYKYIYSEKPKPASLDEHSALARYLDHIIESNRRLQLQGIRSAGQLVSIELEQVYITLTATERRTAIAEKAWLDEMAKLAPGEAKRVPQLGPERARETVTEVKVKVQDDLASHSRLVVVGDPGCGKTTLLCYLALTFARDFAGLAGLVQQRLQLTEQRLPILLPLRDFASHLESHHTDPSLDGPKLLLNYLIDFFANQDIALPDDFFADLLRNGDCAVLLDGVDEVADLNTRYRIARIIERFTIAYPKNRFVVTSRIVGYTGNARLGEGYTVTKVRDFTRADIERFVGYWNLAVELALAGEDTPYARQQAGQQTTSLLQAIDSTERVRELAVNPLLLTVIALVQRYRAQLPERRTELYEEAIEVLLGKWDEAKGLETKASLAGRELDAGDRRSLLEPIALWMMEQRAREIEAEDLRHQLNQQFLKATGDAHRAEQAVNEFLRLINERSGLLAERGQGIYSFSHLTFQEHLAGRAVSDRQDYIAYTLERSADSWWREVILLEAGYLSTQGKRRVSALIQAMMNHLKEPEPYHNLVLAAECLRDVGLARVEGDLWQEVQRRLRQEFERPLRQTGLMKRVWKVLGRRPTQSDAVQRRAAAAEALARIESGGPGTQPAFWRLPFGEPVWVEVPAGEFWMGSDENTEDEKPAHNVFLDAFKIALVPITNSQYRFFVEASGHTPPSHWEDGRVPRGEESHPVVDVTWNDALAYCRWLAELTGKPITLPSEAQWEKAARGHQDRREYPWGNVWEESKCNTIELGLSGTTPVGIFPDGASPYGCLDMTGNVWEWTTSIWGSWTGDKAKMEFSYPYDPSDGRENLEAGDEILRVLRGGSWYSYRSNARCAYRNWFGTFDRFVDNGFRVVVSPISAP